MFYLSLFQYLFQQESLRLEMESQRDEIIHQNNMEKEEMQNLFERAQEELNNQLIALQRDRDDSLLLAENEKQQVHETFFSSFIFDPHICWYVLKLFFLYLQCKLYKD